METQNNTKTLETVSYPKDQIQLVFNILNSMSFTGIQQAKGIAQISVILDHPIAKETTENNEVK